MARVAVVNDDPRFLARMQDVLEMEGWEPLILRGSDSVVDDVKQAQPELILLEIREDRPQAGWTMVERLTNNPETGHGPAHMTGSDSGKRIFCRGCQLGHYGIMREYGSMSAA